MNGHSYSRNDKDKHAKYGQTPLYDFVGGTPPPRESEKMLAVLRSILNEVDAYVFVSDLDTDEILFANRKLMETFKLDDDVVGKICWQTLQKGFTQRCHFCPIPRLETEYAPVVWETRNTLTGRYYQCRDTVIEWTTGKIVHLHCGIDITDGKTERQQIDNYMQMLKHILNGIDSHVYVSDMDSGEILFINNRMKRDFNLGDDAVGKICWRVLQQGLSQKCSPCPIDQLRLNPGVPVVWDGYNTVTKKQCRNVESLIDWVGDKKVHMQHSTDITDILAAQQETREVRERLEIALAASRAGVWEMTFDTDTLTYDAMCGQIFGFDPAKNTISIEDLALHLEKVIAPDSEIEIPDEIRRRSPYADKPSRDYHLVFDGGDERYVRDFGNTIRDENGETRRIVGMCFDITSYMVMARDLKAAKEEAEKANRAKSQFLSNMSHEIRTPMNAIMGMTEILLNDKLSDRQRHYMNDIKVSAKALLGLINDILDFSKIEAGKMRIAPVDYDIMNLLENLESMFTFAAESKGIYFYMDIRDKLPAIVHGDDIRVRQVLINVINNAVKFTKTGGVTVSVGAAGGMLCFDVSDTGVGIRVDDLKNIFREFSRLDAGNNRNVVGTGLGLSITKSLLSLMNGSIEVESEYGRGSTFRVRIPLVPGRKESIAGEPEPGGSLETPGAEVLVVDDNELNRNVACELLKLFGATCDTAASGWEAIQMVAAKKYDIVFMDHMMPELDGVETAKIIRECHDDKALVIVALTANAIDGSRQCMLDARMNDYLAKPIDKAVLERTLCKWLPAGKVRRRAGGGRGGPAGQGTSGRLGPIRSIEGIDVRLGLEHLGGLRGAYEKSLAILARRLPETMERLSALLENDDPTTFAIEVHGLKGSLATVGAVEMSASAASLEAKAKENDLQFCRENLPALATALAELQRNIAAALVDRASASGKLRRGDREALIWELAAIRDLLDAFEGDKADEILERLAGYDYGTEVNEAIQEIRRLVEVFEYNGAIAKIDALA